MDVGVIGISYRSSDLILREKFAKICQKWLLQEQSPPIVVLSTCNRTEVYFSSASLLDMYEYLLSTVRRQLGIDIKENIYAYFGEGCFRHLTSVTVGLDSIILGETEIQRQVKQAYEEAKQRLDLPYSLHYLFQKNLKISKEIRTQFHLPRAAASLEATALRLLRLFFPKQTEIAVLLVGYSAVNRSILHFFAGKKGLRLSLATRSLRIQEAVQRLPWSQLPKWPSFDMVICASKNEEPVLCMDSLLDTKEPIKTKLILDLGVPRNVDPKIDKHPLISLLNIEDIGKLLKHIKKISLTEQWHIQKKIEELSRRQLQMYTNRKPSLLPCK